MDAFVRCECEHRPTHHGDHCRNHVEVTEGVTMEPALCIACLYTCEDG